MQKNYLKSFHYFLKALLQEMTIKCYFFLCLLEEGKVELGITGDLACVLWHWVGNTNSSQAVSGTGVEGEDCQVLI